MNAFRGRAFACCSAAVLAACTGVRLERSDAVFYRPTAPGTEAMFDPLRMSLQYVLDGSQIEGTNLDRYDDHLQLVWDHLREPVHTIATGDGGWRDFVNSEIAPIDADNADDSIAILPNVFLHTLGGGMLFRKTAEWLEAHDAPAPWFTAGVLSMVTEVLAEASEKPTTDDTDEIADVLLYRPLGLWLFADAQRSTWVRDNLRLVDWPYLLVWDVDDGEFANVGMNYALRPKWFESADTSLFAHLGISNVFGLSHRLVGTRRLAWGVGASTETVKPVELRWTAGLFFEDDGGLLASLLANCADGYAVRANAYPGAMFAADVPLGLFAGVRDDGDITIGVQFELPIGLGF